MILKEFIEQLQQYDENLIVKHSDGGNIVLKEGIFATNYFAQREEMIKNLLFHINNNKRIIQCEEKNIKDYKEQIKDIISRNKENKNEPSWQREFDTLEYSLGRCISRLEEAKEDLVRLEKNLSELPVLNNAICIDTDEEDCDDYGCGCGCGD
jgi:hypothetical protein